MSKMKKTENVKKQYADDKNLSSRIKLHARYSTNPYAFPDWLFDQYTFTEGCNILELGCGTGKIWESRLDDLPAGSTVILSDFSEGMLSGVLRKYAEHKNVTVQKIDIQEIPYNDSSFDVVIANHMLYHVPDVSKALSEVHRVLKPKGVFYSSTISSKGMQDYLHRSLKDFKSDLNAFGEELCPFTIENGADILKKHFNDVKLLEHIDSLKITETQDLIDWIASSITIEHISENELDGLYNYFESIRKSEGTITIPKRAGMFISSK